MPFDMLSDSQKPWGSCALSHHTIAQLYRVSTRARWLTWRMTALRSRANNPACAFVPTRRKPAPC